MIYLYDKKQFVFKSIKPNTYLKVITGTALTLILSSFVSYKYGAYDSLNGLSDTEKAVIIKKQDQFDQEKLVTMMKELNVKFPWIPLAQSMVETGHWKSNIFVENNNLFGMKEAKQRITTASGTQNNHAYYETWRESVYDYAFYQSRYLASIRSEQEYFQYLKASYAEDPNYINAIKQAIEQNGLKQLFQ